MARVIIHASHPEIRLSDIESTVIRKKTVEEVNKMLKGGPML